MDKVKKLISLYGKITGENTTEFLETTTITDREKSNKILGKYPK